MCTTLDFDQLLQQHSGIIILESFSEALLDVFIIRLLNNCHLIDCPIYEFDARFAASTPMEWARSVSCAMNTDIPGFTPSQWIHNSFHVPVPHLSLVRHAEHLNCFKNFPECRNALAIDPSDLTSGLWILHYHSAEAAPAPWPVLALAPLDAQELKAFLSHHHVHPSSSTLEAVLALTGGYPEYIQLMIQNLLPDPSPAELRRFMDQNLKNPRSPMSMVCLNKWLQILLFTRGFGNIKAVLEILAADSGLRLVDIARRMDNSLPAVRDYLRAASRAGIIHIRNKRYSLQDPVLARWVLIRKETSGTLHEIERHEEVPGTPSPEFSRDRDDLLEFD